MRVVLMGRSLRGEMSGVVRYTHELVTALAPRLGTSLTVLLTRAPDGLDDLDVSRVRAPFRTPNEYARAFWEQTIVPTQVARLAPDVYHSPNYILPLALQCPSVVTIHDMAFFDATVHRRRSHLYLSFLTTRAIAKASRLICVSQATHEALVDRFPAAASKARVITEGVSDRFRPASSAEIDAFRVRHDLQRPLVLFVGTIEPRKNLVRLIEAFSEAVNGYEVPHDLVIAGGRGWKNADVWAAIERSPVRERIRILGYLDDADLPVALSAADVLCYPSLQEGFGLPPLEAMACGTPVVTSSCSSMPEVMGGAAHLVDPTDTDALCLGLVAVLADRRLRDRLTRAGLARAAQLGWDAVADQTLAIYEEAVG